MIVPSIDLMNGRAVQLRGGRDVVLEGGDPFALLDAFAIAGEVAVVDLDAALGRGSNAAVVHAMVRRAACRVGGGIRDLAGARAWLDAGAAKIVLGTAARPELCAALPRERVIAAVDAVGGEVVVEGWRAPTGVSVLERIHELAPLVSGFLFTQVEHEGAMGGFDFAAVAAAARAAAPGARLTAAGGITTADEIAALDGIGVDAQVGMALYTGRLSLADAVAAPLAKPLEGGVWPTVVCDEEGRALGLAWSTPDSLKRAIEARRGIYWSRSRQALWVKGETSGNTQDLRRVDLDCDRDAVRFTVRQHGAGFCHLERRACWPAQFGAADLARTIAARLAHPDPESRTTRLLRDPNLLAAKLAEEAAELARAATPAEVIHETADLLYFALVALARGGGSLPEVQAELARRHLSVSRRPLNPKPPPSPPIVPRLPTGSG